MHNFTAKIKVKEPVSMTESRWAVALFAFTFRRQTKHYFVYDVTSGKSSHGVHLAKHSFSEHNAANSMAKNGYQLEKLELV